jgi:hypothetical protein
MSKPHLIVLKGAPESGKTTAIGNLYKNLTKGNKVGRYFLPNKDESKAVETRALVYKDCVLIGILSAGDNISYILDHLGRFIDLRCEIIVCACHPNNNHTDRIEALNRKVAHTNWIDKKTANNQDNERAANEIKNQIDQIIKNFKSKA